MSLPFQSSPRACCFQGFKTKTTDSHTGQSVWDLGFRFLVRRWCQMLATKWCHWLQKDNGDMLLPFSRALGDSLFPLYLAASS